MRNLDIEELPDQQQINDTRTCGDQEGKHLISVGIQDQSGTKLCTWELGTVWETYS